MVGVGLEPLQWWWVPASVENLGSWCIQTHGHPKRSLRRWKPVRLAVDTGTLVPKVEVEGAVIVVVERITVA